MKIKAIIIAAMFCGACGMDAAAQDGRWVVRPHASIGVGNVISTSSDLNGLDSESGGNSYGVDLGYRFFSKGGLSLGANVGVGISTMDLKLSLPEADYSYMAGSDADMDGESYVRHYELSDMRQRVSLTDLSVPVYVDLSYRFSRRVSVYALAGVKLAVNMSAKAKELSGSAYAYGVYPQYGDLLIDSPWLNGFGDSEITSYSAAEPEVSALRASVMAGAGVEVWLAGPLSLNCGIGYEACLTDVFKSAGNDVPLVSYTVTGGQSMRSLTSELTKSRVSRLSVNVGLALRF